MQQQKKQNSNQCAKLKKGIISQKAYEMCARERDVLDVILYLFIVFSNLFIYAT